MAAIRALEVKLVILSYRIRLGIRSMLNHKLQSLFKDLSLPWTVVGTFWYQLESLFVWIGIEYVNHLGRWYDFIKKAYYEDSRKLAPINVFNGVML